MKPFEEKWLNEQHNIAALAVQGLEHFEKYGPGYFDITLCPESEASIRYTVPCDYPYNPCKQVIVRINGGSFELLEHNLNLNVENKSLSSGK